MNTALSEWFRSGFYYGFNRDNIAHVHLENGNSDSAYAYYRASFDHGRRVGLKGRILAGGGKSVVTLLKAPEIGRQQLKTAREIMAVMDSLVGDPLAGQLTEKLRFYLRAKVNLEVAEGDMAGFNHAMDQYFTFRDSISDELNNRRIRALEKFLKRSAEEYTDQLAIADLEAENSRTNLRYAVITGALLFIVLIFVGIVLRNKVRYQRAQLEVKEILDKINQLELDNAGLKKRELEQELQLKKRDVDDLALEIKVRSKARSDLIHQLEAILRSSSPNMQLRVLLNDLRMQADHQQISDVRLERMESVSNDFKDRLTKKYPKLSRTDLELCELFLLDIPVKEIANIRKITPESVRMGKYRIRKKLGLTGDADLKAFLKEL